MYEYYSKIPLEEFCIYSQMFENVQKIKNAWENKLCTGHPFYQVKYANELAKCA